MKISYIYLEKTCSTQTFAKKHHQEFPQDQLTCIQANEQTHGKGTNGKSWFSPKEKNLYVTYVFYLKKPPLALQLLSQLLAYSIAHTLMSQNLPIKIKWPNDLFLSGKKCGGVLTEVVKEKTGLLSIFSGFGLNIELEEKALEHLDQPATSLFAHSKKRWDKTLLLQNITERFAKDLTEFTEKGPRFLQNIQPLLLYLNQNIKIATPQKIIQGRFLGISPEGGCLIKTAASTKNPLAIFSGNIIPL